MCHVTLRASQGLINVRNKKLETLVNAAAGPAVPHPHARTDALDRIDLREESCIGTGGPGEEAALGNGPAMPSLPEITEDGAEGMGNCARTGPACIRAAGSAAAAGCAPWHLLPTSDAVPLCELWWE